MDNKVYVFLLRIDYNKAREDYLNENPLYKNWKSVRALIEPYEVN